MNRLLLSAMLAMLIIPARGDAQNVSAEEIKAQYIIKMRPFVLLGEPARTVNNICYYEKPGVAEEDSVGQLIDKHLKERPPKNGQEISVKWYKAIRDFSGCDIFFIPEEEEGNIDNILANLVDSETLTISSAKRFIYRKGMVGFVLDDENRVKMEVNLKNLKAKNVQLRAEILELMLRVINQ